MTDVALHDVTCGHQAFRPPKRITVAEGVEETLVIKQPGGYVGPWCADETPYMVEPMNMLASRKHESVCFVGPARTGKTLGLITGWMSHCVVNDPGDMMICNMTQDKAREMSKVDIDRAIRNSPKIDAMMGRSQDDNTHDKLFVHGMWLKIAWPTVSNFSGSTYRYVALTDYDRWPDDIDGEGSGYGLALKRTQTFLSRGKTLVESSPGRDLVDPHWRPATLHEAPPCTGILGIYNRSDRRRFYWQCPDCREFFEAKPGLELFGLPPEDALLDIIRTVDIQTLAKEHNRIICPHCGCLHGPRSKHDLNRSGLWVPDGQIVTKDRKLEGKALESSIAGYWHGGVSAAYQSWLSILSRYLMGLRDYVLTGSELSLINTINTDQGMPYMPKAIAANASMSLGPKARADDNYERYIVPQWARFLAASVDVQGGRKARFVVEVHAIGPHNEQVPIDRYVITKSERLDEDGDRLPIQPAEYPEDWDILTERVVKSTYRIQGEEDKELRIRRIYIDTGGEASKREEEGLSGVTEQAYEWYRRIRRTGDHARVVLGKGASTKTAPLVKVTMVGAKRTGETGDIPLHLVNPNLLKDGLMTSLNRPTPGPGYMHIPSWLPDTWFEELEAETRKADGTWERIGRKPNETLDLCGYIRAIYVIQGCEKMLWDHAPGWARPLDKNTDVITREERREMQAERSVQPAKRQRRVSRSAYLSRH